MLAKRTKDEKRWHESIVDWANFGGISEIGLPWEYFDLHHPVGRTAKHNKILIGRWWVFPIPKDLHDVHSNHPLNVTHHRKAFEAHYGTQSELWAKMVNSMREAGYDIPFGRDVEEAVATWRR